MEEIPTFETSCIICGKPAVDSFTCPECEASAKEAELARETQMDEAKRLRIAKRFEEIVPKAYRVIDPKKLEPPAKALLKTIRAYDYRAGRGFVLVGPSGQGKTRLAVAAMKISAFRGASIGLLRCAEMRAKLWESFEAAAGILKQCRAPDILLIDDIGQGAASEQIDEVTLAILEARTGDEKITLVTTQWDAESLIGRFKRPETGLAIARRIGFQFNEIHKLEDK